MNQLTKRQKELLLNNKEDLKAITLEWCTYKDGNKKSLGDDFDSFASQFEEKKDWEIISCDDGMTIHNYLKHCLEKTCKIHSVKYKDQVFTIDDETDKGRIRAFVLRESELKVHVLHGALFDISEVKKVERKVRFTTNGDNEDLFVGDIYYYVSSDKCYLHTMILVEEHSFKSNLTYFKSKEKAEEFIELNSPKLSVNEVMNIVEEEEFESTIKARLTSLVKSKSKSI